MKMNIDYFKLMFYYILLKMNKKLISDDLYVDEKLKRMKPVHDFDMTIE
jgi:hypothetical protein